MGGTLLRRAASTATIFSVALLSKLFLRTTQRTTILGLPAFVQLLEARRHRSNHDARGLLTVSNHTSVLDDPLIWGSLPLSHVLSPAYMRHALGSADICFRHPLPSHFFTLGQVHRTFRLHKSPLGGLFQPTLNQLPHLLSGGGWVHIFPEGRVHQHPTHQMRYFKWGVSRLILEPEVAPVVVPMFITGLEQVMAEDRGWPRFIPRVGKKVEIVYGDAVPTERWEDVRAAWQALRGEEGEEAAKLRIETTRRVREEVVNLRRRLGFPDEEPGADDPATYRLPGMDAKDGKLKDGSMVKDT